jgi:uncharacterized protein YndB with AHSA1/START domain
MTPGTIPAKTPAGTGYTAEVTINAPIESVFAALATVERLRDWWTPAASRLPHAPDQTATPKPAAPTEDDRCPPT